VGVGGGTQSAMATNGAHKLKPEQVAALAFARAAGVAEPPHPPKPAAVPAAQPVAVAVQDPPQTAVEAVPPPPEPAPVTGNGNGTGHGDVPAPLTPAGRRPPAQPLRRPAPTPAPARRMPTGPPARRETSARSVILISLLGLLVAGGVAFGAIKLFGGSDDNTPPPPNRVVPAGTGDGEASDTGDSGSNSKSKAPATPPRAQRTVLVLNGTPTPQLAAGMKDQLLTAGYADGKVAAADDPNGRGVTTSSVFYVRGSATQARDVARVLHISSDQVKPIDATLQASAQNHSVVVEIGADKSGN
jgi:LytR cell envelope-related transcriptional attenuator